MLLGEIVHAGVIKADLGARTKAEAIEELVDLLVQSHEIPLAMRDHITQAVIDRENSMSTGMENGIALPHGASDRVDDIIGALGISKDGIPFESLDGLPAHIVILLILPRKDFQGHVRTLAGIAHLMNNAAFRKSLVAIQSVDDALELIEAEEDKEVFSEFRKKP